jgi:hypothetical protein
MTDADTKSGRTGPRPRRLRGARRRQEAAPLSPEERASQRGPQARRAAAAMTSDGPWQWQWRRRHRRGRTTGCLLWLLTLLVVFLVLALLFGTGFRRGSRIGGSGPARPAAARLAGPPAVRSDQGAPPVVGIVRG